MTPANQPTASAVASQAKGGLLCKHCHKRPATIEDDICPHCYSVPYIERIKSYEPSWQGWWSLPGYADARELIVQREQVRCA